MTDSETRALRSYLTNCLEPALRAAKAQFAGYEAERAIAASNEEGYNAQHALGMKRWAEGKVCALESAISEFKELFAEELGEEVNVESNIHPHQLP